MPHGRRHEWGRQHRPLSKAVGYRRFRSRLALNRGSHPRPRYHREEYDFRYTTYDENGTDQNPIN